MKNFGAILFLKLFFLQTIFAQQAPSKDNNTAENKPVTIATVKEYLKKLQAEPDFKYTTIGFSLKSTSNPKALADVNANKSLAVASNTKLFTTSAALDILGEDFTFKTILEYTGKIDPAGTLNGDLIIRGSGDPTLCADRLKTTQDINDWYKLLIEKIKAVKIKRIKGHVVIDQDIFDYNATPDNWLWTDIGNYYGAGAYGFNFNENYFRLYFNKNTTVGSKAEVLKTDPSIADLQWLSTATIGEKGTGDNCYIYGVPYTYFRFLQGTIPPSDVSFWIKGAMPDPPLQAAQIFAGVLMIGGIANGGATTSRLLTLQGKPLATERKNIYTHTSIPLKEIVSFTNLWSVNLYAEALLKTIAVSKGQKGTTQAGAKIVEEWLKEKEIKTAGFQMFDGCGLSPFSSFTAEQITELLKYNTQTKYFKTFNESLPLAGATGTLTNFGKGTKIENNVRAKTGNMQKVASYAGYISDANGNRLCFSFIINNFTVDNLVIRKKVEKLLGLIAEMR